MNTTKRIVVTGSAGRLGRAATRALLAEGHTVVGFDRVLPPHANYHGIAGEITDQQALRQAFAGADVVIHLAATPDDSHCPRSSADDPNNFLSDLVPSNVIGTYQVMEACWFCQVPRVILASTGQVIDGHLEDLNVPVTASSLYKPRYLYACTKVFTEAIGQVYSTQHGLTVLAVRLGWCPRDLGQVAEIQADPQCHDVYLSPYDAGRFFCRAVAAVMLPKYSVMYATSRHVHHVLYDLGPAQKYLGYAPQDQWPHGATDFT